MSDRLPASPLRRPARLDHLIGFLLCIAQLALLMGTSDPVGVPRDESFYFYAADRAADWYVRLFDENVRSFSNEEIDRGWKYNHEHPVLMKTLFGLSHHLLVEKWGLVKDHRLGYRIPTMAMAGMAVWLAFLLGVMVQGRGVGLVAALALALQPRVFFHSHLACFDAPVTFAWLLICFTWLRATRSRRWGVLSGVALGIGLATKLNTFFVPFVLLCVSLVDLWQFRKRTGAFRAAGNARGPLTYMAWTAVSMVVLGIGLFFLHWPWLWYDTVQHVSWYVSFHAKHVHYPVDYLGTVYFKPPFPVHFPFVYALFTVPVPILVLGAVGLGTTLRRAWAAFRRPAEGPDRQGADLMLLANLAAPMLVIALPSTPIFGGTKHWMPAMPFLAVLAGLGAARVVAGLWGLSARFGAARAQLALTLGFGGLCMVPAAWATMKYGPHGPAYFNEIVGGAPGAAAIRMPRNFWGYSTVAVLPWLNAHAPKGALAFWHDATSGAIQAYQRDGALRPDVRYTGDWTAPYSDFSIYCDERAKYPEELDIWREYGSDWPVTGHFVDGVQLVGVYQRKAPPVAPPVPPGAR
jgi:4-amino-4-deoxy-L-arabinose transferase-like glycosyltransferase